MLVQWERFPVRGVSLDKSRFIVQNPLTHYSTALKEIRLITQAADSLFRGNENKVFSSFSSN